MIIRANTRMHAWRAPSGGGRFRPNGKLQVVGDRTGFEQNPATWTGSKGMLSGRLFVGFNVGAVPTWPAYYPSAELVNGKLRSVGRSCTPSPSRTSGSSRRARDPA